MRRAGGVAALLQAVVFVAIIAFNLAYLPSIGVNLAAPDIRAILANAGALGIASLLVASNAVWLTLMAVALHRRLRDVAPALAALGAIAGVAAAILFLADGMVGYAVTQVATIPDASAATPAAYALDAVRAGLTHAARIAVGAWGILVSAAALRTRALPAPLNYLGFLWGVTIPLAIVLPPLGLPVLPLVWAVWLATILLRGSGGTAAR